MILYFAYESLQHSLLKSCMAALGGVKKNHLLEYQSTTLQGRSSQSYPFLQKYSIKNILQQSRELQYFHHFHHYNNFLIVYRIPMKGQSLSQSTQLKLEEMMTQDTTEVSIITMLSPIRASEENNLEMNLKIKHSFFQKTPQSHRKQQDLQNLKGQEGSKVTLNSKQIKIVSDLLQKYAQKKKSQKQQCMSELRSTESSRQESFLRNKSGIAGYFFKNNLDSKGKRGKNVAFSQVIAVKKFRKDDYIEGLQFLPERYQGLNYLYKERQRQDLLNQRTKTIIYPQKKQKIANKKNPQFLQLCTVVFQKIQKQKLLS